MDGVFLSKRNPQKHERNTVMQTGRCRDCVSKPGGCGITIHASRGKQLDRRYQHSHKLQQCMCAWLLFHITPRDRKHIHRKPDPSFVSVESTALTTSANPRDEPGGIGTPRSTLEHE